MRSEALLDRAGDLLRHGRAGRAATLLAPVVGAEPDNVDAWLLLAHARLASGRPRPALHAARVALRLQSRGAEALYWVSAAYSALGRHDLALAASGTARTEEPGHPRLAERHGRALLAAGRVTEAEQTLGAAAEIAHYDADLHVAHGVALFAAGRPVAARQAYGRALLLEPGHPRARAELRRLAAAEARIVDAGSLVRAADTFAESLRVPPGGHPQGGVTAHVSAVVLAVCLVALLVLGVLVRAADAAVPTPLLLALAAAAGSAACVTTLSRRAL